MRLLSVDFCNGVRYASTMSNATIHTFLTNRKKEIFSQIKALRHELAELRLVEQTLSGRVASDSASAGTRGIEKPPTFQDMIVQVLAGRPQGATAIDILQLIEAIFGKKIIRSSISPQLSRLKSAGVLILENNMWRLVNAPDAESADPGEEPADD